MKASPGLFVVLLTIWMGASTYWYVCKIKDHCNAKNKSEIVEIKKDIIYNNDVNSKIEEPDQSEISKEELIEDVKSKISSGFTVYYFPKNSTENNNIESAFDEFADNLKLYLEENTEDKIELTGHTDNIGGEAANNEFGKKRALFIKSILTAKGINANRFIVKSKGKNDPVASNDTEEGRKQNRRVVIKLIDN